MVKNRLLSLLVAVLMMLAAAICVNKALFGNDLRKSAVTGKENAEAVPDSVTRLDNRTVIIHSGAICDARGYAGPVPVDVYISDGKISEIEFPDNAETPGFFKRASALAENWIGKTPEQAKAVRVDAVTGATYSSKAIIANVDAALECYTHSDAKHSEDSTESPPLKIWIALAITLAACIIPLFVKNRIYHTVQLIANVVVLGFWCGSFLDYTLMLGYLSSGIPLPVGLIAICMLAAAFIYPVFSKPEHYCSHICPLGSAQQLAGMICGYKIKINAKLLKGLEMFRKILWGILMLTLWGDTATEWMDYELFGAFMPESAPVFVIIAAILFLLLSTIVSRPYCRFLCPTGSLFKRAENLG